MFPGTEKGGSRFTVLLPSTGLPAVVTVSPPPNGVLFDGVGVVECCQKLEEGGADVVGVNCQRGPENTLPLLREIKKVCKVTQIFPPNIY